jgi:hypothetical protein
MKMFDNNGNVIGNKTITQGAGQQKPDGSYGNSVSMQFEPQKNPIINSLASRRQQASSFPNNYPNGIKPPQVHLKTGEENTAKIGNFLQYRADIRNANMTNKYDALNMKNNQFLRTLANSKFQAGQDRLEKEKLQGERLALQQQHHNDTMGFNREKFEKNYKLNKDKFDLEKQTKFVAKPTEMKSRADIFDTMYQGYYDENTKDALDGNEILKSQARNYYMQHGKMPSIEAYDGESWFGDDYRIVSDNPQQNKQKQQQYDSQKVVGNKKYVQKNGKWYEL